MMRGPRVLAFLAAAVAVSCLSCGCGGAANEENITTRAQAGTLKEGEPKFKSYAEYQLHQTEQAKKNAAENKGKVKSAAKGKRR